MCRWVPRVMVGSASSLHSSVFLVNWIETTCIFDDLMRPKLEYIFDIVEYEIIHDMRCFTGVGRYSFLRSRQLASLFL